MDNALAVHAIMQKWIHFYALITTFFLSCILVWRYTICVPNWNSSFLHKESF